MPGSSRSHGLYQSHVIHLTPEGRDAFLAELRQAAERLQHDGDEFVLNTIDCPGQDGQHKLTLKLATNLPLTKAASRDLIIAGAIAVGCIALIAVAFIVPKPKHDGQRASTQATPAPTIVAPGPEYPHPTPAR